MKPAEPNALAANVVRFSRRWERGRRGCAQGADLSACGLYLFRRGRGAAYRLLAKARGKISRVVLLGPSHRFPFSGMATTSARAYETPLGVVPIDQQWLEQARDVPFFGISDEAHEGEHCLETQLPFLQQVLGDFKIAPIICGRVSGSRSPICWTSFGAARKRSSSFRPIYRIILTTRLVARLDETTRAAIERLDPVALTPEQACGATPVKGLLTAARRRGCRSRRSSLCNSGDTAGPRDRVVGYGAWAFWEQRATLEFSEDMVRRHGASDE